MDILNALKTTTEQIKHWANKTKADKTMVNSISEEVETINGKLDKVPNDLVILQGRLYLAQDGVPLSGTDVTLPEGGGGGSGGGDIGTGITVINKLTSDTIVVASGAKVELKFFFSSVRSGNGTAYIYVTTGNGSKQLKGYKPITNGYDNPLDITSYVGEGINIVEVVCSDSANKEETLKYTVEVIALSNDIQFSDGQVFTQNTGVPISIKFNGNINKTLHFKMTYPGDIVRDYIIEDIYTDNASETYDIYDVAHNNGYPLTHGVYLTEIFTTATTAGGVDLKSESYVYDIIFSEGKTTPLIGSPYSVTNIVQGEQVNIPFTVFHASNPNPEVTLSITPNEQDGKVYVPDIRTVDGGVRQIWSTKKYPSGSATFTISYGGVSKSHTVTVSPSEMKHKVRNANMKFYISAANKSNESDGYDTWVGVDANNNNVANTTFTDVNWTVSKKKFTTTYTDDSGEELTITNQYAIGTGWTTDDNGDGILRLSGDARAVINFQPYLVDPKVNGKTIELVFSIGDVNNRDATVMECMSNGVGFTVKPDHTIFTNGSTSAVCNYVDGERIHLTLVIEPRGDENNPGTRLFCSYINGVMSSAAQYASSEILHQSMPVGISVGSSECSIDLYAIRTYDIALTKEEVRNNFIAEMGDVSISLENDIYNGTTMLLSKIENVIPVMRITGEQLPSLKNDSNKKKGGRDYHINVDYTDPFNPDLNFEDHALIHVQGTSSETYPRKNWKIEFDNMHQHMPGAIPSDVFCMKCDFAENTGSHNTANANYVHTFYSDCKTPPQQKDSRVRTTIAGFPCLIFYRKFNTDAYEFAGKYNFNYEKSSLEAYGFTDEYPQAESWEFRENKELACQFLDVIPEDPDEWDGPMFEARYPDKNQNIENFRVMHNWVMSTNQDNATGEPFNEDDWYTDIDGNIHKADTKEYRLAKFKTDFEKYFELDFMLIYYVYSFFMMMVDQRCKNMFLTTWDQKRWAGWFYDNDTCLGINNEGKLVFDYYHQDYGENSTLGVQDVYNGKSSVLWTNFHQAFADKIAETYDSWRKAGSEKLSYEKLVKYFIIDHTDRWPISVYNEDSEFKYINLLRKNNNPEYLYQVRGTGEEHFKYITKNRLMFCDSKWLTGDFTSNKNRIVLRLNTPNITGKFAPNSEIRYKTFSNMYAAVRYGTNTKPYHVYTPLNKLVTFSAKSTESAVTPTFKDTDTYIFGADQISYLDDLSLLYCSTINISAASKLIELNVGRDEEGYENSSLTGLSFTNNRLLQKVNVCNCTGFKTKVLDFTLCPNIQEVYATGSNITGIDLPDGGYLKIAKLPASIDTIKLVKQKHIQTFECSSYANLKSIRVEDSTNVPIKDILNAIVDKKYPNVRIVNMDWSVDSEAELSAIINKVINCKALNAAGLATNDVAVLTGRVTVKQGTVSSELRALIHQYFPDLVVVDGAGVTYYFIDYLSIDGEIFYTELITDNEIPNGPTENPPNRDLGDHRYIFEGWDMSTFKPNQNNRIAGMWAEQYAVYFYNDIGTQKYITIYSDVNEIPADPVLYGVFTGELPTDKIYEPTKASNTPDVLKYKFNGWALTANSNESLDALPVITGVTDFYATFVEQYPVKFYQTSEGDRNPVQYGDTQWIIKGQDAIKPATNPTKASTAEFEYKFLGWVGDYINVIDPRNIYANYEPIRRSYNVYFYNPGELDAEGKLVVKYKTTVLYGNTATYRGDKNLIKHGVEAEDVEKYTFVGWSPLVDLPVTGETNYYALFKFTAELKDSWDTIANNATLAKANDGYLPVNNVSADTEGKYYIKQDNTYQEVVLPNDYVDGTEYYMHLSDYYPLGSRKSTTFTIEGKEITAEMEVIAYEHDYLNVDGTDRASLTFFCRSLPNIQRQMHSSAWSDSAGAGGNVGGYPNSDIRTKFLNDVLYNAFEDPLRQAIKPVYKYSDGGYLNKQLVQTQDYCWLASYDEIFTRPYSYKLSGQGDHYSNTFINKQACQKFLYGSAEADAYARSWWLRSSYCDSGYSYLHVRSDGDGVYMTNAATSSGPYVAFGFCI